MGAKGGNFFYLTAASRDYGLTSGSRDTAEIGLTDLGRSAVFPQTDAEERQALVDAFLHVEVFRRVLDHYGGNNLPERKFLANTLHQTFGVDPSLHDEFVDLFNKNCRFLGIGTQFRTSPAGTVSLGGPVDVLPATESGTVTVATPDDTTDAPVLFVIMPFTERDEDRYPARFFEEVLTHIFVPAGTDAGFQVRTAQRLGSDVIQHTIVRDLLEADLVLADLTEHNPNVLFELGMRMHHDRPVALVRARGTGPIFDVDNMLRVEQYDPNVWPSTVEADLPRITDHIKAAWENRDSADTYMKILARNLG